MKTKRIIALMLCAIMMFALVGCSKENPAETEINKALTKAEAMLNQFENPENMGYDAKLNADIYAKGLFADLGDDIALDDLHFGITISADVAKEDVSTANINFSLNDSFGLQASVFVDKNRNVYFNLPGYNENYFLVEDTEDTGEYTQSIAAYSSAVTATKALLNELKGSLVYRPVKSSIRDYTAGSEEISFAGTAYIIDVDCEKLAPAYKSFYDEIAVLAEKEETGLPSDINLKLPDPEFLASAEVDYDLVYAKSKEDAFAWSLFIKKAADADTEPQNLTEGVELTLVRTEKAIALYTKDFNGEVSEYEYFFKTVPNTDTAGTVYFCDEVFGTYNQTEDEFSLALAGSGFDTFTVNKSLTEDGKYNAIICDSGSKVLIELSVKKNAVSFSLDSLYNDAKMVTISGSFVERSYSKMALPKNTVDAETWTSTLDSEGLQGKLINAIAENATLQAIFSELLSGFME